MNVFEQAAAFNRSIIGLEQPATVTPLTRERRKAIADHIREEAQEFEDAEDLDDQIDAMTDVIYLGAGRFFEMGADGPEHMLETHYCNMKRVRGDNAKRPGSVGFDAVKPEGWVGPDHAAIRAGIPASRHVAHLKPRPKVLVLGHARHGKDTVAEMLRDRYGLSFSSSSMFCAERIIMPYFNTADHLPTYATVEDCYADRVNHRATWFNLIQSYNSLNPARLAQEMIEAGNDMYVGMRSDFEFSEARKFFDFIVWVDASGRGLPKEPADSFDIPFRPGMLLIRNNGTLEDLKATVDRLAKNHLGLERAA